MGHKRWNEVLSSNLRIVSSQQDVTVIEYAETVLDAASKATKCKPRKPKLEPQFVCSKSLFIDGVFSFTKAKIEVLCF